MEKSCWGEMGADFFIRSLQDFARSSERKLAELSFEKVELERRVLELESLLAAKDRIIKEYLRRVALLEFAIKKEKGPFRFPQTEEIEQEPFQSVSEALGCREILKRYLMQMDALGLHTVSEKDWNMAQESPPVASKEKEEQWSLATVLRPGLMRSCAVQLFCPSSSSSLVTIVGSEDGLVRIWTEDPSRLKEPPDLKSVVSFENCVNPRAVLRGHLASVTCVSSVSRSSTLFTGDAHGEVLTWSLQAEQLAQTELFPSSEDLTRITAKRPVGKLHHGPISCLELHPTHNLLASAGSNDRFVALTRIQGSSRETEPMKINLAQLPIVTFWDPSSEGGGARLITASKTGGLFIHDTASQKEIRKTEYGIDLSTAVHVESMNAILVSFCDGSKKLIDMRSFATTSQWQSSETTCVASSGYRIAYGCADGSVHLKDVRKLDLPIHTWRDSSKPVSCLAFPQKDGDWLASASTDGKVYIYGRQQH